MVRGQAMLGRYKAEGQVMLEVLLHKYNTIKRWIIAAFIVALAVAYPVGLLIALIWCMLRVLGFV
jgi:hypothetical protein